MKKTKTIITTILALTLLSSCASKPEANEGKTAENHKTAFEKNAKIEEIEESPEDKFIKSLQEITIKNTSAPKEVVNGRAFASPFTFQVTDKNGAPLSQFPLTLTYPASKTDNKINFESVNLLTDENGTISFTAEPTSFAAKTTVTVYPTPDTDSESLLERVKAFSVQADWKVRSNIASKGAVLFIWDFNEKDRPINNSYDVQAEFRGRGISMVGNGPVNETSYIGKPQTLYKETYEIIGGNQYGYLIYGTIKFEQPVTALENGDGYNCILKSEMAAVSMKNGSKIYSSEITYESIGKNWNECVSKGKSKLAELVVNDIMYGL